MKKLFVIILFCLSFASFAQTREQLILQLAESNAVIEELLLENEVITAQLEASNEQIAISNNQLVKTNEVLQEALVRIESDAAEIVSLRTTVNILLPYATTKYYSIYAFALYDAGLGGGVAFSMRLGKLPLSFIVGAGVVPNTPMSLNAFLGIGFMP